MNSLGLRIVRPALLAILVCGLWSAPEAQQPDSANIIGRVRLAKGGLLPERVAVSLHARGVTITSTYTDNEGQFFFSELPGNLYHLVIKGEGYQTAELSVPVRPNIQRSYYLNVQLTPLSPAPPSKPDHAVQGSNPGMVDPAIMVQSFPRDARKQFDKGSKLQQQGKAEEAIKHYEKALSIAPNFYFARNNLGSLYLGKQEYKAAELEFRKVIETNQADAAAYFNLGNVCLLTKRYNDALVWLQEGMRREPNSALGHFLLGSTYTAVGSANEAEKSLQSALRLDPKMANARLALVNLYLAQSRKQDAVRELQQFLKDTPDNPFAPKAEQVLKQLQNN